MLHIRHVTQKSNGRSQPKPPKLNRFVHRTHPRYAVRKMGINKGNKDKDEII